jgi:hypothetical protein
MARVLEATEKAGAGDKATVPLLGWTTPRGAVMTSVEWKEEGEL